jgi:hypothetical protein
MSMDWVDCCNGSQEGGTNHLQVDGHQFLFRAAEDVELAIVSIADFDKLSQIRRYLVFKF